jgi:hypothetical protein
VPLPDGGNTPWPPKQTLAIDDDLRAWNAWYTGSPDKLAEVYGSELGVYGSNHRVRRFFADVERQRGALGFLKRMFWSATTPEGELRTKLHVPIASDISAVSADLLFAEPPSLTVVGGSDATQKRLDFYVTDGMWTSAREGGERASAGGGAYGRIVWDDALRPRPWITWSTQESVVPEWRWDQLSAATFWRVLPTGGGKDVVRHLERHEPGAILHGVYVGDGERLGRRVDLGGFPETSDITVDDGDAVVTGTKRLTCAYVPNMRPNRVWDDEPWATNLGRSDYQGVEGLMDVLDETWSSWMRDIRLAKARLIVPQHMLVTLGKGQGAKFDLDQEIFVPMDLGPQPERQFPELVQPEIRMADHRDTAAEILEQVVRNAGYSMQTLSGTGQVAQTATEVMSRERRSMLTRRRKINYMSPQLVHLIGTMLEIDVAQFGPDQVMVAEPRLEWPKAVFVDPMDTATTVQMLRDARVVSIETAVRMLHPDWSDKQIGEEIQRLEREEGIANRVPQAAGDEEAPDDELPDEE